MCGAPDQAVALPPGTDLTKETVLTGRVVAEGHPVGGAFVRLWFGFSRRALYLRLDPARGATPSGVLHILISRGAAERTLRVRLGEGDCPIEDSQGVSVGTSRMGSILELAIDLGRIGLLPNDSIGILLRLTREDVEVDRLPRYGELSVCVPDEGFESAHWHV